MKIALVCEHGGHLTQMLQIIDSVSGHDYFFITNISERTKALQYKKYLINPIGTNPIKMIKAIISITKIFKKEKPEIIISTGAEIAIPAFIIGKLMGAKLIYIESWSRLKTKSTTGKLLYYLSDIFIVQWPQLLEKYGKKARYFGGIL